MQQLTQQSAFTQFTSKSFQDLENPRKECKRKGSFRSEEADTLATQSWSEMENQKIEDLQDCGSGRLVIEIQSRSFEVDCWSEESVKGFLEEVGRIRQLGQKVVQIKVIVLDSISRINPEFQGLLAQECEKYGAQKIKRLFGPE